MEVSAESHQMEHDVTSLTEAKVVSKLKSFRSSGGSDGDLKQGGLNARRRSATRWLRTEEGYRYEPTANPQLQSNMHFIVLIYYCTITAANGGRCLALDFATTGEPVTPLS